VARRLAKSGEGFYHLAVAVEDVESTGNALSQQGLTVIQRPPLSDKVDGRWLVHPRSSNGILVEGI
jgi:lactoylglutathione lyase/methylmalonyl-CoA/ethylmalonyl-CoA epimerase